MDLFAFLYKISIWAIPVLFAITLHEVAHGWMARYFGDRTAEMLGRLSLNPLRHIDPIGTVLVPGLLLAVGGLLFGWAKPVPVATSVLRNPRRAMIVVALAGPAANFTLMLLAGIAILMWLGRQARIGALGMLDLAAPAVSVGYGVGRIGCLTSGDGDYGIKTTLPWGVHMAPDALVPTRDLVQPTPIYELLFSLALAWLLWRLGRNARPVGWMTGLYLVLSGIGRFLVEFVRINPRLYWGMSNAQMAALGSIVVGGLIMALARKKVPGPVLVDVEAAT